MALSVSALRPADIIVSTTDAAVSAVIRAGSGSSVSHSMISIGGGAVVEAVDAGVVVRRPRRRAPGRGAGDCVASSQPHREAAS